MNSQTPEDEQFYEPRMRFLHDQESRLIAARKEGYEEGLKIARQEVSLAGQIQLLQEILDAEKSSMADLLPRGIAALTATLSKLKERIRSRGD
ncbi:MAG: hypothetical protein O3C40_17810 [Planctomycetota bacterium]|nr:hypothetical protein [Planctomycetota bacterium]